MRRAAAASALRPEFRPGLQSWPPPFEARRAGRAPCPRPPWRWRLRLCRRDNGRGSPAATEAMPEAAEATAVAAARVAADRKTRMRTANGGCAGASGARDAGPSTGLLQQPYGSASPCCALLAPIQCSTVD